MVSIRVAGVWKQFRWHQARPRTLKEFLLSFIQPSKHRPLPFNALKDVSFEIERGEMLGIIGDNGSGKSTILKLITGISKPNRGTIEVQGRISALLELGAGFHPDFTGRENIFLNASILGLRRQEIEKRFDAIVEFSELKDFIDNPVKTYSSGMYMRLAFAIAVNVDPDILVIDEVLAVGDAPFQKKCFDQIRRFRQEGKTILLVTHDLSAVRQLCDRAIWLQKGTVMAEGTPDQVIELYNQRVPLGEAQTDPESRPIVIRELTFSGSEGQARGVWKGDSSFVLSFTVLFSELAEGMALKLKINKSDGVCCYSSHYPLSGMTARQNRVTVTIPSLSLLAGNYILEVCGVAGPLYLEVRKHFFSIQSDLEGDGVAPLFCDWNVSPEVQGVVGPL